MRMGENNSLSRVGMWGELGGTDTGRHVGVDKGSAFISCDHPVGGIGISAASVRAVVRLRWGGAHSPMGMFSSRSQGERALARLHCGFVSSVMRTNAHSPSGPHSSGARALEEDGPAHSPLSGPLCSVRRAHAHSLPGPSCSGARGERARGGTVTV